MKDVDLNRLTYRRFAEQIDKRNPGLIITREVVDRELERINKRCAAPHLKGTSFGVDSRRRRFRAEADEYWKNKNASGN